MDWDSSALWGIIGLVGGIVVSSFFYFLGIKRKFLIYDITTTTLVSKNDIHIEKLNITYDNKPIKNLYTSTIKIKNNSNSVIELNDFAPAAPLSLVTNGEFLTSSESDIKLYSENNYNNIYPLFEVDKNNKCQEVRIHFDYISKKETIYCTVFHTDLLSVNGRLKDGKLIPQKDYSFNSTFFMALFILLFIVIFMMIGIIWNQFYINEKIINIILDDSSSIRNFMNK